MGTKTDIQWCDSTVNPTTGCDGCELWDAARGGPCYAGNYHETRMAKALPLLYAPAFADVRLVPGRMAKAAGWSDLRGKSRPEKPWLDGLPRLIFVGDMADIFSRAVPFEYLESELIRVATGPKGLRHVWMLLTKRPRRMAAFAGWLAARGVAWPGNIWAGTSITGTGSTRRIVGLLDVPAPVRFLSVEPQVEEIDLDDWLFCERCRDRWKSCGAGAYLTPLDNAAGGCWFRECGCSKLDLVIQGGESVQRGHGARPFDLSWARKLRDDCKDAGVRYFLKQVGSCAFDEVNGLAGASLKVDADASALISKRLKDHHGGDWDEWPADLRVRQFPTPKEAIP